MIPHTERNIDHISEYHTRLIADLVTGKLDVRQAAAGLPDEGEELEAGDDLDADSGELDDVDGVEDAA